MSLLLKLAGAVYLVWYGFALWLYGAFALTIAALSAAWHLGIALAFAAGPAQSAYRRLRRPIEGACGAILVLLGLRLASRNGVSVA